MLFILKDLKVGSKRKLKGYQKPVATQHILYVYSDNLFLICQIKDITVQNILSIHFLVHLLFLFLRHQSSSHVKEGVEPKEI